MSLITNPRVSFIRLYVPQNQAAENEEAIREEFDKLRKFLVEEERHRLKVLRQEEEVKKQVMSEKLKTLTAEIQNLSANVGDIEMALKEKDLPFLMVTQALLTQAQELCFCVLKVAHSLFSFFRITSRQRKGEQASHWQVELNSHCAKVHLCPSVLHRCCRLQPQP